MIDLSRPFPWTSMLAYLSWRCTPGFESMEGGRYTRKLASGFASVEYDAETHSLRGFPAEFAARVGRLFDSGYDPRPVERVLRRCPILGPRVRRLPGLRPP